MPRVCPGNLLFAVPNPFNYTETLTPAGQGQKNPAVEPELIEPDPCGPQIAHGLKEIGWIPHLLMPDRSCQTRRSAVA